MSEKKPDSGLGDVVLVTAGAAGIGRTIAEKFIQSGCRVHVCDISQDSIDDFLCANTAVFLGSDLGRAISGQSVAVDGHTESLSNWLD